MKNLIFILFLFGSCTLTDYEGTFVEHPEKVTTVEMLSNVDTVVVHIDKEMNRIYIIEDNLAKQEMRYVNNDEWAIPGFLFVLFMLMFVMIGILLGMQI